MRLTIFFGFIAILGTAYHHVCPCPSSQTESSKDRSKRLPRAIIPTMFFPPIVKFLNSSDGQFNSRPVSYCYDNFCNEYKCGLSDSTIKRERPRCNCDAFCEKHRDCCIGYKLCTNTTNAEFIRRFENYIDCTRPVENITVSQCPDDANGYIADACASTGNKNDSLYKRVPVSSSGVHFRNIYCSQCHNISIDDTHFWRVKGCFSIFEAPLNVGMILKRMFVEQFRLRCQWSPTVPLGHERSLFIRSCGPKNASVLVNDEHGLIDACPWNATSDLEDEAERKCHVHNAFVYAHVASTNGIKLQRYKNVYCARCNGVNDTALVCPIEILDGGDINEGIVIGPHFGVSIKPIQKNPAPIAICNEREIFDELTKMCRALIRCGIHHVQWNGECFRDPLDIGYTLPQLIPWSSKLGPRNLITIAMNLVLVAPLTLFRSDKESFGSSRFFGKLFEDALDLSSGQDEFQVNITATFDDRYTKRTKVLGGEELILGKGTPLKITFYQNITYPKERNYHLTYIKRIEEYMKRLAESPKRFELDYTIYNQGVRLPLACNNEHSLVAIPHNDAMHRFIYLRGKDINNETVLRVKNGFIDMMVCDRYDINFQDSDVRAYNLTTFHKSSCGGFLRFKETGSYLLDPYLIVDDQVYVSRGQPGPLPPPELSRYCLRNPSPTETTTEGTVISCSAPVCNQSQCGVFDEGKCYCDAFCVKNQDCCFEYEDCDRRFAKEADHIETFKDFINCNQKTSDITVSSCPKGVIGHFADECEYPEVENGSLYRLVPVTSRGVHFRNIYCSQCHNVPIADAKFWSLRDCDNMHQGTPNVSMILAYMFSTQLFGSACQLKPSVPAEYEHSPFIRSCGPKIKTSTALPNDDHDLIYTCSLNATSAEQREIERKCRLYSANVYAILFSGLKNSPATLKVNRYKNMYCARCNGIVDSDFVCPVGSSKKPPDVKRQYPIVKLMTPNGPDDEYRKRCKVGELYDKLSDDCRPLLRCGLSHVEWEGQCIRDPFDHGYTFPRATQPSSILDPKTVMTVDMKVIQMSPLTLIFANQELNDPRFLDKAFQAALAIGVPRETKLDANINITAKLDDRYMWTSEMAGGKEIVLGKNAVISIKFYRAFAESEKNMKMAYIRKLVDLLEQLATPRRRFYLSYTVYSQGVQLPVVCDEGLLVTIPLNESLERYFKSKEVDVNDAVMKTSSNDSIDIITCDKFAVKFNNCDIVTYNMTSFHYENCSQTYKYISTGQTLSEPFVIIGNQVYVCVLHNSSNPWTKGVSPDLILVLIILSLVFLVFTILLHILLKDLRTLPGLMLTNLCAVLFIAQLLYITAIDTVTDSLACFIVAIVTHYFWLATFFWMNAIAFNMAWTFSHGFLNVKNRGQRRLIIASCYAYGAPGVIVLICTLLDKFSDVPVGYGHGQGQEGTCWFTERKGLIFAFFLPVGLIIAANLILFIITTVSISRAKRVSKVATKHDGKADFVLYIKLSFLMGFTWLFGFLTELVDSVVIWHIFAILNSALGVFISLAFSFNKRTWTLLRSTLGRGKGVNSSNKTTKTNSNSSVKTLHKVRKSGAGTRGGFDAI
ncbi:uncharacterized protein LOC135497848 [Lineus longissimus]|uniref:uncharacterized protein LOC135497848 n=1 Tax=Lineus longissimus TaxID=88925 RepID=UPI00315D0888